MPWLSIEREKREEEERNSPALYEGGRAGGSGGSGRQGRDQGEAGTVSGSISREREEEKSIKCLNEALPVSISVIQRK